MCSISGIICRVQDEEKSYHLILDIIEPFITSLVVFLVIYLWVAFLEAVSGASMEPTLHTGDRILVERLTPKFKGLNRGDIVILHPPGNDTKDYVKRVIGLPGEIIRISDCNVYISKDGQTFKLNEPYLAPDTCTMGGPIIKDGRARKLNADEYVVLGDNRGKSADSRIFGPINKDNSVLGKVVYRVWPVNSFGSL